jgi:DNA-binding transcriptional activator of the SARP family
VKPRTTLPVLSIKLFGKLTIDLDRSHPIKIQGYKSDELFAFLLLNRNHAYHREHLAELLWSNYQTDEAPRNYLRKALWKLQNDLCVIDSNLAREVLIIESKWIELRDNEKLELDVKTFERIYQFCKGLPENEISLDQYNLMKGALELYQGDLLEGCYHNWCTTEREYLKEKLLFIGEKLIGYCEAKQDYMTGIEFANWMLKHDPAHERTHIRIMRMQYISGNRSEALRQYERCSVALRNELNVEPGLLAQHAYQQIAHNSSVKMLQLDPSMIADF